MIAAVSGLTLSALTLGIGIGLLTVNSMSGPGATLGLVGLVGAIWSLCRINDLESKP